MLIGAINLKNIRVDAAIGTYGPDDIVPDVQLLDLILQTSSTLILIAEYGMAGVFDYDPLLAEIDQLARDCSYETEERLVTRIVSAGAAYPQIEALEVALSKKLAPGSAGSVGVRLALDAAALATMR